ncbi:MAG: hypothetical protein LC746_06255, partial [Acidobacteria bacterium]|nr:hypothetical protein [Acidobacteriota bacterium]
TNYLNVLSKVTIYTSLESCAQCSGIMALGKVKSVVYLQPDPGQFCVGNIMYNLTTDALRAPLPVSADKIGLKYFRRLKDGYRDFYDRVTNEPFYTNGAAKDNAQSITSYLCTDEALAIYDAGRAEFASLKPAHPEHKPATDPASHTHALTNERALANARTFLDYATSLGKRGTPHKL